MTWLLILTYTLAYPAIISPDRSYIYEFYHCQRNLAAIGTAMQAYHDDFGRFPPSFTTDDRGNRMHSWRVLLLPYLGDGSAFYAQYRFDEPWDSRHNKSLLKEIPMPAVFRCPANRNRNSSEDADYLMVVGENCISNGEGSLTRSEIGRDGRYTVIVVEVARSGIKWTEPCDLEVDSIPRTSGSPYKSVLYSRHLGRVNVLFADGYVESITDEISAPEFDAITRVSGIETSGPKMTPPQEPGP